MKISLTPNEMSKLAWLWEFHRKDCTHAGTMHIDLEDGAIGTTVIATCGCGKEMNVTDYLSW